MKRPLSVFALLGLTATILQAAPSYTIHLSNSERFSDCTVIYRSSTTTKFRGKNRNGKEVIKEIPTSSIMYMAEVKQTAEPTPAPAPKEDDTQAQKQETPDTKPAVAEKKEGDSTAEPEESKETTTDDSQADTPPPAPQSEFHDANVQQQAGTEKAKDATLRLRDALQKIDASLAEVNKPSRSLRSICDSTKLRVETQLKNLDKLSLEVADLQSKFNTSGIADYQFQTKPDDRDLFLRDATAAYEAMVIDMKERKSRRKVGGLDKFEILHMRYQGAPEYKSAHEWYIKTLRDLHKKWNRMLVNEKAKRKKLPDGRAAAMVESDEEEFAKMEAYFQREGEEVSKIWYTPSPRNLKMLNNCINKVNDNLRRNEYTQLDREAGSVPELLTKFWTMMDETRNLMVCGNLEAAEAMLNNDTSLQAITRLKVTTMPQEYRKPLSDENRALLSEIRKRSRDRRMLKTNLERKTNQLDRAVAAAESQINNALDAIEREKSMQTEESTMEIVGEEPEVKQDKKPADGEQKPAAEKKEEAPDKASEGK